ncbi:MAG: hypothetical protein HY609_01160 [Deltaproteobacteria bacterium]|nr:hypothetical protein [Deltaproteobacteria bacterium]MBI4223518.1 hypothetical protein [Deltaproteobacteria bacterium]
MTELLNPITGPVEIEAQGSPEDKSFGFDACGGGHFLIPTSLTEAGSGYQFCGRLNYSPDTRNVYHLGFHIDKESHEGGDLYNDQDHDIYVALFGRGQRSVLATGDGGQEILTGTSSKSYYLGLDKVEGVNQFMLGTDIASYTLTLRTSGRFGIGFNPYLRTYSSIPLDSEGAEAVSALNLQAGFELNLSMLNTTTRPPTLGLIDFDVAIGAAAGAHRLGRVYGMAQTLSEPAARANETSEAYGFTDGSASSARLEDVGLINTINAVGGAGDENLDLKLQLQGNAVQQGILVGSKAIYTGLAFALSTQDESPSTLTHGFAGSLGLVGGLMATGMGLDRPSLHGKTTKDKQNAAGNFLLFRSLLNAAGFAAGWALREERAGPGLLQGSQQASLAAMSLPDPAGAGLADDKISHHFVYEAVRDGGRYFGYQQTVHLPDKYLYTRMRLMGQTVPAPGGVREGFDDLTGRDPLVEGAKAAASASLGGEFHTGPLFLSAGVRTLLAYGDGPEPVPGVGAEEQVLLSLGDDFRVEFGVGASQDYLNDGLQLSVSGVAGARFTF